MSLTQFITNLSAALAYPGAHQFYFPPDAAKRRDANLRLAREFGFGLADSPKDEVDREIGSAYGQLVVMHSLDRTGVQIDAKTFVNTARAVEMEERQKRSLIH